MMRFALLLLCSMLPLEAQSALSAPPVRVHPGMTDIPVSLELRNAPGATAPAALQWDLTLPAGTTVESTAGAAAVAAGKSLQCARSLQVYTCIVSGINRNTIGDGAIASLVVHFSRAITTTVTPILLSRTIAASLAADRLDLAAQSGAIELTFPRHRR